MNNLHQKVLSYLKKHSIPNYELEWNKVDNIQNVIVIPAIAEFDNLHIVLNSLQNNNDKYLSSTLIIFVINNSISASDEIISDNQKSLKFLRAEINNKNRKLNVGLVDASSFGKSFDEKTAGVGLARKVGMDLALTAFDFNREEKKILFCTDADCTFTSNYISAVTEQFNIKKLNAAYVNFEHDIYQNDENTLAIICYEIFLRYYVAGLKYAKSPYAFHTIGSTMICDIDSYIKIGGMNKRKAAEDFYFLEKMAKSFNICRIEGAGVFPSNRKSWRVPFGTGQRVNRFLSAKRNEYLLYDPRVFDVLKQWLIIFNEFNGKNIRNLLNNAKKIHNELYNFLIAQKFEENWERIFQHTSTMQQLTYQKKIWFDGFRTLKFIHHFRDNAFPEIDMFDALDSFFKMIGLRFVQNRNKKDIPPIDVQRKYLLKLRKAESYDT